MLRALAPYADGFEVSSGGEFEHVRALLPDARLSFGWPGKTGAELALAPSAYRWHVESTAELRRLRGPADVLLRVNLDVPVTGAALAMGGGATPFGMDRPATCPRRDRRRSGPAAPRRPTRGIRSRVRRVRTPVIKGHDQPFAVLPRSGEGEDGPVTLVGRLCTPKDVFARRVTAALAVGDVVAFAMAGAYAWNISHHDFLMHPKPEFHYLR